MRIGAQMDFGDIDGKKVFKFRTNFRVIFVAGENAQKAQEFAVDEKNMVLAYDEWIVSSGEPAKVFIYNA